jgi:hypothetical protein
MENLNVNQEMNFEEMADVVGGQQEQIMDCNGFGDYVWDLAVATSELFDMGMYDEASMLNQMAGNAFTEYISMC